ncbi:hypothetical protein BRO54_0584 [Geobacillus proteiniphilus]|uniref:Uncharacterized protein n=1 Tax=Geobacillus proteiniphilus TaxID=860353 RepID=A0A1Q5T7E6_9BACL|nr:hypothetical protein BRO54_0584 [Geobacillus proteiniphilus]
MSRKLWSFLTNCSWTNVGSFFTLSSKYKKGNLRAKEKTENKANTEVNTR